MKKAGDIAIRPWTPRDAVEPVTALLHRAYGGLAAMGFRYVASHQDDATTLSRLTRGTAYLATAADGTVVGTISLYEPDPAAECAWYRVHPHFGQFAVEPAHQRQGIGLRLLEWVQHEAGRRGAAELALDTAEGADHLRRWYGACGYRLVAHQQWGATNYRSVILSRTLGMTAPEARDRA